MAVKPGIAIAVEGAGSAPQPEAVKKTTIPYMHITLIVLEILGGIACLFAALPYATACAAFLFFASAIQITVISCSKKPAASQPLENSPPPTATAEEALKGEEVVCSSETKTPTGNGDEKPARTTEETAAKTTEAVTAALPGAPAASASPVIPLSPHVAPPPLLTPLPEILPEKASAVAGPASELVEVNAPAVAQPKPEEFIAFCHVLDMIPYYQVPSLPERLKELIGGAFAKAAAATGVMAMLGLIPFKVKTLLAERNLGMPYPLRALEFELLTAEVKANLKTTVNNHSGVRGLYMDQETLKELMGRWNPILGDSALREELFSYLTGFEQQTGIPAAQMQEWFEAFHKHDTYQISEWTELKTFLNHVLDYAPQPLPPPTIEELPALRCSSIVDATSLARLAARWNPILTDREKREELFAFLPSLEAQTGISAAQMRIYFERYFSQDSAFVSKSAEELDKFLHPEVKPIVAAPTHAKEKEPAETPAKDDKAIEAVSPAAKAAAEAPIPPAVSGTPPPPSPSPEAGAQTPPPSTPRTPSPVRDRASSDVVDAPSTNNGDAANGLTEADIVSNAPKVEAFLAKRGKKHVNDKRKELNWSPRHLRLGKRVRKHPGEALKQLKELGVSSLEQLEDKT